MVAAWVQTPRIPTEGLKLSALRLKRWPLAQVQTPRIPTEGLKQNVCACACACVCVGSNAPNPD